RPAHRLSIRPQRPPPRRYPLRPGLHRASEEQQVIKGFRQFILRGNVVDLAVAVVIGTAFGAVIAAVVKDLLTPLIAAIFGKPDFSTLTFDINNSTFRYGDVINAVISFLSV